MNLQIAEAAIQRVQRGLSQFAVELVHVPHPRWPQPSEGTITPEKICLSILDASYNPPTLAHAHLALANSSSAGDARLLLLSIRNADKTLKSTDVNYVQRLQMMTLLANGGMGLDSAAVAIIDEPTFVGKSSRLLSFFQSRQPLPVTLTFILGFDTLERFLSPRYYSAPSLTNEEAMHSALRQFFDQDGSRIVCARRSPESELAVTSDLEAEQNTLALAEQYGSSPYITLIDLPEPERSFSSSSIRKIIADSAHKDIWKQRTTESIAKYIETQGLYRL